MVTQFECDKGHVFIHVAKHIHFLEPKEIEKDEDTTVTVADSIERDVCPFCFSPFVKESLELKPLEDMLHVEYANVKEYLAKGYVQLDEKDHVYAKGLIMYKRAEPKSDYVAEVAAYGKTLKEEA